MDKLESMYAFTQVVENGSFAEAARKMNLSRSSVNKLVIQLEIVPPEKSPLQILVKHFINDVWTFLVV